MKIEISKGKSVKDVSNMLQELANKSANLAYKGEGANLDDAVRNFAIAKELNTEKLVTIVEPNQIKIMGLKTNLKHSKLVKTIAMDILR